MDDNLFASLGEVVASAPRLTPPPPLPSSQEEDGLFELKEEPQTPRVRANVQNNTRAGAAGTPRSSKPAVTGKGGGPTCPSCKRQLDRGAIICTSCGIHVITGQALITAKGFDENDLAIRCDTWIRIASIVFPTGLYPVDSEALGFRKPSAASWPAGRTASHTGPTPAGLSPAWPSQPSCSSPARSTPAAATSSRHFSERRPG